MRRSWVLIVLALGCAVPGQPYLVAPAISGSISGDEAIRNDGVLMLSVMHRESPDLFRETQVPISADGTFQFEAVELVIAGHEYSKVYRLFLHLQTTDQDRVIWRASLSRRKLAGLIELACDLDRPLAQGQPCWVNDPLSHPWLVAEGHRTFQRLCASCHGPDGGGEALTAADIKNRPPDLRTFAARHGGPFDRASVAERIEGRSLPISHGRESGMPIWGERLSAVYERYVDGDEMIGATLDPILAYLESLQTPD